MNNIKPIKKIAVIHDLCGVGKAALTNVIPILSVMGYEVCPIPTMLLSTHTGGFGKPAIIKTESYLREVTKHYKEIGLEFNGILIGYLGDKSLIEDVLCFVKEFKKDNTKVILDPIFADNGKYYSNFDYNYMNSIRKLIEISDVITPNYTEACYLSLENYIGNPKDNDIKGILDKISNIGCRNIVITSMVENDINKISTLLYEDGSIEKFATDKLEKSYPGTGDIFVSVLFGYLLKYENLSMATEKAVNFVFNVIKQSNKYDYESKHGVLLESSLKELL